MKKFHYLDTIISPNVTEKATSLSEFNKIVFKVNLLLILDINSIVDIKLPLLLQLLFLQL